MKLKKLFKEMRKVCSKQGSCVNCPLVNTACITTTNTQMVFTVEKLIKAEEIIKNIRKGERLNERKRN